MESIKKVQGKADIELNEKVTFYINICIKLLQST